MPKNTRLAGHGIPFEGKPVTWRHNGNTNAVVGSRRVVVWWTGEHNGNGRTVCLCGEKSPTLPNNAARQRWGREHKETERAKLGRPTVEPLVFEETVRPDEIRTEDAGAAKIFTFYGRPDEEAGVFVRLQSWDEDSWKDDSTAHEQFRQLVGRKVRITVEVID